MTDQSPQMTPTPAPWYRQKKWLAAMFVGVVILFAAVGGKKDNASRDITPTTTTAKATTTTVPAKERTPSTADSLAQISYCDGASDIYAVTTGVQNKTILDSEIVSKLKSAQNHLGDAYSIALSDKKTVVANKYQAAETAVGQWKVAQANGDDPTDAINATLDAANALPKC